MTRTGIAKWNGSIKEGKGTLSTQSGVLKDAQYSFNSRFADGIGTNPEELIAAAHSGCFTMKLTGVLGEAGIIPESVETKASVTIENGTINKIHLETKVKAPGLTQEKLMECAGNAKANCPVSKLVNAAVTMEAQLG
jgi:osmotically inducible protein OsmC